MNENPEKICGISHVRLKVMLPPLEKPAAKTRDVSMPSMTSFQTYVRQLEHHFQCATTF